MVLEHDWGSGCRFSGKIMRKQKDKRGGEDFSGTPVQMPQSCHLCMQ
jgi:hypothetical protein